MAEQKLIDTQWVDILPPVPPEPVPVWIWLSVAVLCLAVALLAWLFWQRRPRQQALRRLRRCERQLRYASAPPKQIAAQIYRAVQQAMQTVPTTHLRHDAQWRDYYRRLAQSVFHAREPDAVALREILRETRAWLQLK